jgi:hypothetical protein
MVSQVASKGEGEVGRATANIEETRAGWYVTDGDCPLAPVVMQAKAQHSIEEIIMPGNRGKHLPHSVSHNLPLLLTSNMVVGQSRHIMGNHRAQAQLSHDLACPSQHPSSAPMAEKSHDKLHDVERTSQ